MRKINYQLQDIADLVHGTVSSNAPAQAKVMGVSSLRQACADKGEISFYRDSRFKKDLLNTRALAVILNEESLSLAPVPTIVVKNPQQSFSMIAALFDYQPQFVSGIHETACIDPSALIHPTARVGPYSVIASHVTIGEGTYVGPHCVIGEGTKIGASCYLASQVTLYHHIHVGDAVHIDSGAVIGADGFGLERTQNGWQKIPQVAKVIIGDDVWIGAHCTIDRGALENTELGRGVKLDDQVHVGHGSKIGAHTVVAGQSGIAGSTEIGAFCMIGGGCRISDHLTIPDHTVFTGNTFLTRNLKEPGVYSSGTVAHRNNEWRKNAALFNQLHEYVHRIKHLEKQVNQLIKMVNVHDESH